MLINCMARLLGLGRDEDDLDLFKFIVNAIMHTCILILTYGIPCYTILYYTMLYYTTHTILYYTILYYVLNYYIVFDVIMHDTYGII